MPRYGTVPKRDIAPDAVYDSVVLQKFINKLVLQGKKSKSEQIIYNAFSQIKEKLGKEPLEVFQKALDNLTPLLEVKARRVGGATYQIPIEVSRVRGQAIAMQWLREACRAKKGQAMSQALATELIDAFNGAGEAMKKKEDLHKTAEANKAFAHFRW